MPSDGLPTGLVFTVSGYLQQRERSSVGSGHRSSIERTGRDERLVLFTGERKPGRHFTPQPPQRGDILGGRRHVAFEVERTRIIAFV